jgi:nucleoside-diphosphate-sugar epimerase
MRRNVLVTGATGKQGSAFIRTLNGEEYFIYAVTRDVASPAAQEIAEIGENVLPVKGDLDVPESISKIFQDAKPQGGIWGVFVVLAFPGLGADASGEEAQGIVRLFQSFELHVEMLT